MTARYMGVRCRLLLALLGWLALADTPSAATRSSQSAAVDAIVEAALKEGPFPGISVAIEHVLVFEQQPDGAEKVVMHYYEGVIDATKPAPSRQSSSGDHS